MPHEVIVPMDPITVMLGRLEDFLNFSPHFSGDSFVRINE
jgi:hypothetical protein